MPAEQEYQMKKFLLVTALTIGASPAFADELFDACFKLATDRVGHVSQTAHGHFNKFVRECIRGVVPLPETASAAALASQRSKTVRVGGQGHTVGVDEGGEGRIKCITGFDGQKRCY
jgi:hypothetical protein